MQIFITSNDMPGSEGIFPHFSFFKAPIYKMKDREPDGELTLEDIHESITDNRYKGITEDLRAMESTIQSSELDTAQQDYKRRCFDFITPHGVFHEKNNEGLSVPSWIACVDIDHISNPEEIKQKLVKDASLGVVLAFVSPRGHGVKAFIAFNAISQDPLTAYKYAYEGLENYLTETYRLPWDASVKTINQACYLCYDPNAYIIGDGAELIPFDPSPWQNMNIPTAVMGIGSGFSDDRLEALVLSLSESHTDITATYHDWIRVGYALANDYGESGLDMFLRISSIYPHYSEEEARRQYNKCLHSKHTGHANQCHLGTIFYLAERLGIVPQNEKTRPAELRNCGIAENLGGNTKTAELRNCGIAENPGENTGIAGLRNCGIAENLGGNDYTSFLMTAQAAFGLPPANIYNEVKDRLPLLFQKATEYVSTPEERDIIILSMVTALSSALPNVYGIYGKDQLSPHLFLFIVGEPANNKGLMKGGYYIIGPIHDLLRQESEQDKIRYNKEMETYEQSDDPNTPLPESPKELWLYISANCSAPKFKDILNKNPQGIFLFDTEGDTMVNTFKRDYGAYSDALRNIFSHDPISSHLRNEDFEIKHPRAACLLSGTMDQVQSLIHDPYNGLFSRFLFFCVESNLEWVSQRPNVDRPPYEDYMRRLGNCKVLPLFTKLRNHAPVSFGMTDAQWNRHDALFRPLLRKCTDSFSAMSGTVKRLGMILFRIAMTLAVIRQGDTGNESDVLPFAETIICSDDDFDVAEVIVKACLGHALAVYSSLPNTKRAKEPTQKDQFLEHLPVAAEYTTETWQSIATSLGIQIRTAERYHNEFVNDKIITRIKNGLYVKRNNS